MKQEDIQKHTRRDIISIAEELIREKGYNAFSYADIARKLMIRNAAVHYHFPAKSDLGRAVIDEELDRLSRFKERNSHLPVEEQLKYLVSVFHRNSVVGKVCLAGALVPEYGSFGDELQLAIQDLCLSIMNWLMKLLLKGQTDGSLHFEEDASVLALTFISGLFSALLFNRVLYDEQIFDTLVNRMLEELGVEWRVRDIAQWEDVLTPKEIHSYS